MTLSVRLPLDDGFLRRECDRCERQFKWHSGPTEDRPADEVDSNVYFCPYCGESAPPDHWWTKDQLKHMQGIGTGHVSRELDGMLRQLARETRNSMFSIEGTITQPEPPALLHEPSDMVIVQSPCHPWEPIKVHEDWRGPLFCLICRDQFGI